MVYVGFLLALSSLAVTDQRQAPVLSGSSPTLGILMTVFPGKEANAVSV